MQRQVLCRRLPNVGDKIRAGGHEGVVVRVGPVCGNMGHGERVYYRPGNGPAEAYICWNADRGYVIRTVEE